MASLVTPCILFFLKKEAYLLANVARAFQPSMLTVIHIRSFYLMSAGSYAVFCMEGFLMFIACPIDNGAPEALFTRGVRGHAPPELF